MEIKFDNEKIKENILTFVRGNSNNDYEKIKDCDLIIDDSEFDINNEDSYIIVKLGNYEETLDNNNDLDKYLIFEKYNIREYYILDRIIDNMAYVSFKKGNKRIIDIIRNGNPEFDISISEDIEKELKLKSEVISIINEDKDSTGNPDMFDDGLIMYFKKL